MKIQKMISQHRRDFRADYVCESCGHVDKNQTGYDDRYFHECVIPAMKCPSCGEVSPTGGEATTPKYPESLEL